MLKWKLFYVQARVNAFQHDCSIVLWERGHFFKTHSHPKKDIVFSLLQYNDNSKSTSLFLAAPTWEQQQQKQQQQHNIQLDGKQDFICRLLPRACINQCDFYYNVDHYYYYILFINLCFKTHFYSSFFFVILFVFCCALLRNLLLL